MVTVTSVLESRSAERDPVREKMASEVENMKQVVSTLEKINGNTDVFYHMGELIRLSLSATDTTARETVKVVQSDAELQQRVKQLVQRKTMGSDMLLHGKMGCRGIVQRLNLEEPERFPTERAALQWIQKEWDLK